MNISQTRVRLVLLGAIFAAAALVTGCGNNYRPVVNPVNPSGPAPQPKSLAVVVSAPSPTTPGIATIIDYAGDTIMATAPIGPGPTAFTLSETGYNGYTYDSDGTITNIPVSTTLQAKNISFTTLPSAAKPLNLFSPSTGLWAADLCATIPPSTVCENATDVFSGIPETFMYSIPLAPTPVMVVGPSLISAGARDFALSQNITNSNGMECNTPPYSAVNLNGIVEVIETASNTVSASLVLDPANPTNSPTGSMNARCPVYAVESNDSQRFFVLNRGSDTISVINAQFGTLDNQCPPPTGCVNQAGQTYFSHPILPLSTNAVTATGITPPNGTTGMPTTAGPVYAEYNAAKNLLVVADYDGGTISVIDVSLDEYGNDSATFGTTYTIPVGNKPASVTVLLDGSRAYTANQADQTVTIVNLSSYTVEKTLPVTGYPRNVVSTQNSAYGKVYVASPNTNYLTIIRTDQDIVDTTLLMEGDIVDVRVTTQNGISGNNNNVSRIPGYGQPCNLPDNASLASLAACQTQP